jgi:hypothetical protein
MSLYGSFDKTFLFLINVQYFLSGFRIYLELSLSDLFKNYLDIEPALAQTLISIITIPWSFKILYGIVSDNLPIFGSRKRSYYIINSGIAILVLMPLLDPYWITSAYIITVLLCILNLNLAFNDVISDALMV